MKSVALAATLLCAAAAVHGAEFRSVGAAPAVFYDAPSEKGRKTFVAPRNMPVEVVLSYGEWVKVRDAGGDLSWVEGKALVPKRHVVANVAGLKLRAAAEESAAVVVTADQGVLFELAEQPQPASGWVRIKHKDGQSGWVKAAEVWGI